MSIVYVVVFFFKSMGCVQICSVDVNSQISFIEMSECSRAFPDVTGLA